MANTCCSAVTFYSKNKDAVEKLKNKFTEIYEGKPTEENGFGHGWMGDFANTFYPELGAEKIECRGEISFDADIWEQDGYYCFKIWTYTAWSAMIGLWHHIAKDFYPEVKIAYIGEEYGCDYFVKWDETGLFYPEEVYIDIHYPTKGGGEDQIDNGFGEDQIDDHYCWDINSLTKWLEETMPFEFEHKATLEELEEEIQAKLDEFDDGDEEYYCQFATYAEIPPEDFDWRY